MIDLKDEIEEQVAQVLLEIGDQIIGIWKRQAPYRTGKLRGSLRRRVVRKAGQLSLSFYYIYYGVYVDLGTYQNADRSAYGRSPFEMPVWNARPQKSNRKGIVPRYWTSLSDNADELIADFESRLAELIGDPIVDQITSRTQRNTQ